MLWLKALHIIFAVTWFAGLFYLPRLFVYHAMAQDEISLERFVVMERKLYYGIMSPSAVLSLVFGLSVLLPSWAVYSTGVWIFAKLAIIALLLVYHLQCGVLLKHFANRENTYSHNWYRWFNELPVVALFLIVFLAVLRP